MLAVLAAPRRRAGAGRPGSAQGSPARMLADAAASAHRTLSRLRELIASNLHVFGDYASFPTVEEERHAAFRRRRRLGAAADRRRLLHLDRAGAEDATIRCPPAPPRARRDAPLGAGPPAAPPAGRRAEPGSSAASPAPTATMTAGSRSTSCSSRAARPSPAARPQQRRPASPSRNGRSHRGRNSPRPTPTATEARAAPNLRRPAPRRSCGRDRGALSANDAVVASGGERPACRRLRCSSSSMPAQSRREASPSHAASASRPARCRAACGPPSSPGPRSAGTGRN